ncbi:MAG: biopolymer transporter ExbD [Caulobacterales bacterium]|jgi:biopolymer transport protein ExbD|nr:biopolymer transporter ExbD [Caulobacterales bacterium]
MANVLAMGRRRSMDLAPAAEPNVIPFIDVLLVLLIIFMVTAPKPTVDLRLELPSGHSVVPVDIAPTIVDVLPGADGAARFLVDGRELSLDALSAELLRKISGQDAVLTREDILAEGRVFVRADLDIGYAHVVAAIDQLQHDGFEKVSVFAQAAED